MNVYEKPNYLISPFFQNRCGGWDSNPGTPAGDTWLSRTLVLQEFIFAFCWRIMSLGYDQDFPVFVIFLDGLIVEGGLVWAGTHRHGDGNGHHAGRQRRFDLWAVGRVRMWMIHRVVPVLFLLALPVLAGL